MNLFVLGWRAAGGLVAARAETALTLTLGRLPFFGADAVRSWSAPSGAAVLAWVAHPPDQVGGARYVHLEDERIALFSGRPFRWHGDGHADGRGPLDPRTYLQPLDRVAPALDGRWTAARYEDDGRVLELAGDRMGAYPVYQVREDGAYWVSNNPEVLRRLGGDSAPDHAALAGLLGGGWPLAGHPVWRGVRRLPRGEVVRFAAGAAPRRSALMPDEEIAPLFGAGVDARAAAATLVATLRGLGGWPGRPDVVPVTGGRDSRVILAAAVRAELSFKTTTGGPPHAPDVVVGREIARAVGAEHEPLPGDAHGTVESRPWDAARILGAATGGTATLADGAGFPLGPRPGPLVLWHSGQGGEIARGYYGPIPGHGADRLALGLYRRFVALRPGRPELLSAAGRGAVMAELRSWTSNQLAAGVAAADVPDAFYLLRRMATWAAPSHGCVEWVRDATSPLWSHAMLPHLLGLPLEQRRLELLHRHLLEELSPELVHVPFAGSPWPKARSRLGARLQRTSVLAGKARAQAHRRWRARLAAGGLAGRPQGPGPPGPAGPPGPPVAGDPFDAVLSGLRERALDQPSHPAWEVLDRGRVERLLERHPASLDVMSRYHVWRLVTVFAGDLFR